MLWNKKYFIRFHFISFYRHYEAFIFICLNHVYDFETIELFCLKAEMVY